MGEGVWGHRGRGFRVRGYKVTGVRGHGVKGVGSQGERVCVVRGEGSQA